MALDQNSTTNSGVNPPDNQVVVGVFETRSQADAAIHELESAGFTNEQIGFVSRDAANEENPAAEGGVQVLATADAATGAVSGGIIGGIIGAAAALLIPGIGPVIAGGIIIAALSGIAIGAAVGGLVGALVGLGVPEEEARYYQSEFELGRTIVAIRAAGRVQEAREILHRNGGYDATTRFAQSQVPSSYGQNVATEITDERVSDTPVATTSAKEEAAGGLFEHPTNPDVVEPMPGEIANMDVPEERTERG